MPDAPRPRPEPTRLTEALPLPAVAQLGPAASFRIEVPARHGGRSSALAGRIKRGWRVVRIEARLARRALQRPRGRNSARPRRRESKPRFGTAGAPAPSPAGSSASATSFRIEAPVRHGGRSSALAGRIKRVGHVVQNRSPGSARRALQRPRRPHLARRPRRSESKPRFGTAGAPAPSPAASSASRPVPARGGRGP